MGLRSYPKLYFELLFSAFTLMMGMGLSSAFLSIYASELDPSGVLVGFTVSAWFFSRIFMELPSGVLADRLGRRRLLVSGLGIAAVGSFMCSNAESIYLLIIGRGFWGLGTALFFMSNTAIILDLFKSSIRGRALGTFQSIEFVGSFMAASIGGFIAEAIGYKRVFFSASVLIFVSFSAALISRGLRQADSRASRGSDLPLRETLSGLGGWGLFAVCINSFSRMFISNGVMNTVFQLYLNSQLGMSVELIGIIMSLRTAGTIVATVTSGYLSDKFGRKPIIALGILLESAGLYLYTLLSSFELFLLTGFLEGLGGGMTLTSLIVLLSEVVPARLRGGAIGMYRTFMDVGGFLGPLFFMVIFDIAGSYLTFLSAIIILLLNIALVVTVRTKQTKDASETT